MNTNNNEETIPQKQTAENPSGDAVLTPFNNNRPVEKDSEESKDALDREQQFKQAQTERD